MTGKTKTESLRNLDAATDVRKEVPPHVQPCLHEKHWKCVLGRLAHSFVTQVFLLPTLHIQFEGR